jgi:thiol-disulfide isomerase/thioredoxin
MTPLSPRVAIVLLAAACLAACSDSDPAAPQANQRVPMVRQNMPGPGPELPPYPLVGQPAPDFTLTTVTGQPVKLSSLRGSVVVLDFWATWCPPCRISLPHLQKISADPSLAARGLKVLGVNKEEDKDTIAAFLKEKNYTFTVPMDATGSAGAAYQLQGIPTTVIIGRDGIIKSGFSGLDPADPDGNALNQAIAMALDEKGR